MEWDGTITFNGVPPVVRVPDGNPCSYLVIPAPPDCGVGTWFQEVFQDDIAILGDGGWATIEFDVRCDSDSTSVELCLDALCFSSIRRVIPLAATWTTHRLSLPLADPTTSAIVRFTICEDTPGVELHIDNVRCFTSARDLTTLPMTPAACVHGCIKGPLDLSAEGPACGCPTDVNDDGVTNVLDLIDLLLCFGQPAVPGCESEDVNQDGTVNVLDLIDLLLQFGQACP